MNKKKLIIILVNIVFFLLLLLVLNFIAYYQYMKTMDPRFLDSGLKFTIKRTAFNYEDWDKQRSRRPIFGKRYNKKGFTIFGCSYAFGLGLKDDQTFAYKLSTIAKRPVYTLADPGTSAQFSIMEVQSNKYNDYIKNSDYAIYMVISQHLWRIISHCDGQFTSDIVWPRFDKKNGKLVYHKCKFPIIEGSYIYRSIQKSILVNSLQKKNKYMFNKVFDLFKMHIALLDAELKKRNPNIKLVILIYRDYDNSMQDFTDTPRWKEIEDMGIKVISAENLAQSKIHDFDIMTPKYRIPNDGHPNALSWDIITPLFIKELNIK